MKRRIENRWWSDFLTSRIDCAPLESAIILHPEGKVNFALYGKPHELSGSLAAFRACGQLL